MAVASADNNDVDTATAATAEGESTSAIKDGNDKPSPSAAVTSSDNEQNSPGKNGGLQHRQQGFQLARVNRKGMAMFLLLVMETF